MPINNDTMCQPSSVNIGTRLRKRKGLIAALTGICSILSACAVEPGPNLGQPGFVGGFFGGVAADEPHAVISARDILTAGGTAADAAATLAFSLSVTLPTRAGLGAGGSCLVHDAGLGITEALDFAPRIGSAQGPAPATIPSLTRAMVVLHARYGRLDWREVVAPAERLARFGHRPSRALRRELEALWPLIQRDPTALAVFGGADGSPPTAKTVLKQIQLAALLGQIRIKGAGVLYSGTVSQAVSEAYRNIGGTLTVEDIRGFVPEWRIPLSTPFFDQRRLYTAPPPDNGGIPILQAAGLIEEDDRFSQSKDEARAHLLVEALRKSIREKDEWINTVGLPIEVLEGYVTEERIDALSAAINSQRAAEGDMAREVPILSGGSTGFVVVDQDGMAVACTLTLGGPLGNGRMLQEYGFYPGRAPGRGGTWMTPVIVASEITSLLYYASASTDGSSGVAATLSVLAGVRSDATDLESIVASPRFLLNPRNNEIVTEPGLNPTGLATFGHAARAGRNPSRVNVVYCPSGYPVNADVRRCAIATDGRGNGLSVLAE